MRMGDSRPEALTPSRLPTKCWLRARTTSGWRLGNAARFKGVAMSHEPSGIVKAARAVSGYIYPDTVASLVQRLATTIFFPINCLGDASLAWGPCALSSSDLGVRYIYPPRDRRS